MYIIIHIYYTYYIPHVYRCGESFLEYPDEEAQREHLQECTDINKHKANQQKLKEQVLIEEKKRSRQDLEDTAQTEAVFTFLGGHSSQLYLLSEGQVKKRALAMGLTVSEGEDKDEVIGRIVAHTSLEGDEEGGRLSLEYGRTYPSSSASRTSTSQQSSLIPTSSFSSAVVVAKKRRRLSADAVPAGYHSLSLGQLRSICASNGVRYICIVI